MRSSSSLKFILLAFMCLSLNVFSGNLHLRDTVKHKNTGWYRGFRVISLGVGFQNYDVERYKGPLGKTDSYTLSSVSGSVPLHLKFDFFAAKHLSVGASLNYSKVNYYHSIYNYASTPKHLETYAVNYEIFNLNLRLNYHIFYGKKLDIYVGGGTGIRTSKTNLVIYEGPKLYKSGLFKEYEASIGIRYLAFGIVGAYAEAGLGRSRFQAGLSINLSR